MEDPNILPIFFVPIKVSVNTYKVNLTDDPETERWIDIKKLEITSYEKDEGRLYKYYLAFLDLVSNLCYGRNYKGIK
jgi:hypothetical protein